MNIKIPVRRVIKCSPVTVLRILPACLNTYGTERGVCTGSWHFMINKSANQPLGQKSFLCLEQIDRATTGGFALLWRPPSSYLCLLCLPASAKYSFLEPGETADSWRPPASRELGGKLELLVAILLFCFDI